MDDASRDALIQRTVRELCARLSWEPNTLARRSTARGQDLSGEHWRRYLKGERPLTDKIARAIAAVFSLPDPGSWTAARLRDDALASDWETLGRTFADALIAEMKEDLRQVRRRRPA